MTLTTILDQLRGIDRQAQKLISGTGFSHAYGLGSQVRHNTDDPEERFLKDCIERLLDIFAELHEEISDLGKPTHGEFVLMPFPNGCYGYLDDHGSRIQYHCGTPIEAKIPDHYGRSRWVRTRIGYDGRDFYLVRHRSVPLNGLTVRERR